VIVGSGEYRYELVEGWERLPAGMSHPDVVSVRYCQDTGHLFVFNRSADPVLRFTTSGELVDSWGGGYFTDVRGPHGMYLEGGGTMLLVDMRRNCVERFGYDGKRLASIPAAPTADAADSAPFDKPTCVVVHPNGSMYITDGYGNSFLHRYDADGGWQSTWGHPGARPLEFAIPHGVALSPDGNLLVADRENHRIQVISPDGEYLSEIGDLFRPCGIHVARDGTMFVPELGADTSGTLADRPVPSRVTVLRPDGSVAARWGDNDGLPAGNFVAAHDLCVDAEGSVYVAEVTHTMGVNRGLVPPGTHTLQKFARL
jgi:DNA-binding beta-propeller fold protein YncE